MTYEVVTRICTVLSSISARLEHGISKGPVRAGIAAGTGCVVAVQAPVDRR